jgi:ASC-1-like (ASCH) protein
MCFILSDKKKKFEGKKHLEMHKIACVDPWFQKICNAQKRIDGRSGPKYDNIKVGDTISFDCKLKSVLCFVTRVTRYPSFFILLMSEGLDNVLPGIKTIEEGVKIYRRFYSEEFEKEHGVLAIEIKEDTNMEF